MILCTHKLTLLTFVISICTAAAYAQQGHSIRGKVRNDAGYSIPYVTVTLERNGAMIEQTIANNEGDFAFTGLTNTSYKVVVNAPDYNSASETVEFAGEVDPDSAGETRTVEITLQGRTAPRSPRPGVNFVQNVPETARAEFESGLKLTREKRPSEAVAAYERALKIFPQYFAANLVLGNEYARQGKLDDAIKLLEEARRVNPNDDRVYDIFGRIMMLQHKFAMAARIFAEAARLNPHDAQYPLARGKALLEQLSLIGFADSKAAANEREYAIAEAEKSFAEAHRLADKKLAEVHLQLARLYERKGDRIRAAEQLEQYLQKSPGLKSADAVREAIKILRSSTRENSLSPGLAVKVLVAPKK